MRDQGYDDATSLSVSVDGMINDHSTVAANLFIKKRQSKKGPNQICIIIIIEYFNHSDRSGKSLVCRFPGVSKEGGPGDSDRHMDDVCFSSLPADPMRFYLQLSH